MAQKTPDGLAKVSQQLRQTWNNLAPSLNPQLLKLVQALISALESLDRKLDVAETSAPNVVNQEGEQADHSPQGEAAQATTTASSKQSEIKLVISKFVQTSLQTLEKLRHSLEEAAASSATQITNSPSSTPQPQELIAAGAETDQAKPPLAEQVQTEFTTAWDFVKTKLVPTILAFLAQVVEKIDPPLTKVWEKLSQKVKDTPALVKAWQQVVSSSIWQKGVTATAPIWRSIGQALEPIATSEGVKPILEKRVAASTIAAVLVLILLFKPSPAPRVVAKKIPSFSNTPSQTVAANDLIAPKEVGAPVSPEQIMVTDIQSQVAAVSKKYGEALIQSVQTNFRLGRLVVQLTDAWYQLNPVKQEQLMADILERSQSLSFKKVLVADPEHNLIARSPAVGNEMVILKR